MISPKQSFTSLLTNIQSNIFLWLMIGFFLVAYSVWVVVRHNHFMTDAVDLGIFDQIIWKYSQFKAPLSSVKFSTYPGINILGDHFHPIIALLSPLYWIWDDVRAILIAQVLLVVLSVIPIYLISLKKIRSKFFSLSLAFTYLSFIGLQTLLEYDFHEIALGLPIVTLALYLLEEKRYRGYFVCLLLSFLVKEDMPLVMLTLGIWSIFRLRNWKIGLATIGISGVAYLLITRVVIPYYKGAAFDYEHLEPSLGVTSTDLIKTSLTNPWLVVKTAFYDAEWIKARTMLNLLGSFSFFPLFSPTSLVMLIPNIVSRFLTDLPQRWIIRFQYSAIWGPVMSVGTMYALSNIFRIREKLKLSQKLDSKIIYSVSIMLVISSLMITKRINGPLTDKIFNPEFYKDQDNYLKNKELLAQIPPDSSVMAQSAFIPHLTHRDKVFRYDNSIFGKNIYPEYILMSLDEHTDPPYLKEDLEKRILSLKSNPYYDTLSWDGIRLFMRLKKQV